jgi:hypothetical protein
MVSFHLVSESRIASYSPVRITSFVLHPTSTGGVKLHARDKVVRILNKWVAGLIQELCFMKLVTAMCSLYMNDKFYHWAEAISWIRLHPAYSGVEEEKLHLRELLFYSLLSAQELGDEMINE